MILNLPRNTCHYKLAGTETFRCSSSAWLELYGCNLQNIEKSARRLYWADAGKQLVQVDQAGAEAMIVAYLCKPGNYRELFIHGIKPHVYVAINIFLDKWKKMCPDMDLDVFRRTPISKLKSLAGWKTLESIVKKSDEWAPSERYYFIAKMIVHGLSYGMRSSTFRMNVLEKSKGKIVLAKEDSDNFYAQFHSLFTEIQDWHYRILQQLKDIGFVYNLQGFPSQLTTTLDEDNIREWIAFVPQSTVGVITHKAVTALQIHIEDEKRDWDLLANGHDSAVAQCPIGEEKELGLKLTEFMCQDLVGPFGDKFRMRAEAQTGFNWAPYKEGINEDGLKALEL